MRPATILLLALLAPLALAGSPYVYEGVLVGPNAVVYGHTDQFRFWSPEGARIDAELTWDPADGTLVLGSYFDPDGQQTCAIPWDIQCNIDMTLDATCWPSDGDALTAEPPLRVSFVAPAPGYAFLTVDSGLSTDSVPYKLTLALDGEAPAGVRVVTPASFAGVHSFWVGYGSLADCNDLP